MCDIECKRPGEDEREVLGGGRVALGELQQQPVQGLGFRVLGSTFLGCRVLERVLGVYRGIRALGCRDLGRD
jgi:hypothetical protein